MNCLERAYECCFSWCMFGVWEHSVVFRGTLEDCIDRRITLVDQTRA